MGGDDGFYYFNEVLQNSGKKGGSSINLDCVSKFQDMIDCCSLTDLGFCCLIFSWARRCRNGHFVQERLDRVVVNLDWRCSI